MKQSKRRGPEPVTVFKHEEQAQPRKKLDLKLIMGDDQCGEQLIKMTAFLQLKPEKIEKLCENLDIDLKTIQQDYLLRFDFVTQEGRQKEAIEYFENGLDRYPRDQYSYDLSPLQNYFSRPTTKGKLDLFQSKRKDGKKGVTLLYRIYSMNNQDMKRDLEKIVAAYQKIEHKPDLNLEAEMRGHLQIYKKNRIKMKVDYFKAHFTSNQYKTNHFLEFLSLLNIFGEEEEVEAIKNQPIFKMFQKAEQIQGTLKMASLRKLLELYKIGISDNGSDPEKLLRKQKPQVIKGLFKQEVRITFAFINKFVLSIRCTYESQQALIRMLTGFKNHIKYLQ